MFDVITHGAHPAGPQPGVSGRKHRPRHSPDRGPKPSLGVLDAPCWGPGCSQAESDIVGWAEPALFWRRRADYQSLVVSSSMVAAPAFFWIDAMVSSADVLRL